MNASQVVFQIRIDWFLTRRRETMASLRLTASPPPFLHVGRESGSAYWSSCYHITLGQAGKGLLIIKEKRIGHSDPYS